MTVVARARMLLVMLIFATAFPVYAAPKGGSKPSGPSLELQEDMQKLDELQSDIPRAIEQLTKRRQAQCVKAFGDFGFCKCLADRLPVAVDFLQYVVIVTNTKEDLKYNEHSTDDKAIIDKTRNVRDECVTGK